jgi:methylenetetrahydrofolate reductase (NADPH)
MPQHGMRVLGRAVVVRCLCSLAPATQSPSTRSSFASGAAPARGAPVGAHPPSLGASSGAAAAAIMRDFSIETTPKLAARIENHRALLPPGTTVYVAAIPGTALQDVAALCKRLVAEGLEPVPHLAARAMRDAQHLKLWLSEMQESGVHHVLLLAGDTETPAGKYTSSLDILCSDLLPHYGITHVDIVAHPEGSLHMADPVAEVLKKVTFARLHNISMDIVTQVCFDVKRISELCRQLRAAGVDTRIRIGVCGLATPATLLKYAAICGVGPSLNILRTSPSLVLGLTQNQGPAPLLDSLALAVSQDPGGHGLVSAHFFSFGSFQQTCSWATQKREREMEKGGQGEEETLSLPEKGI